MTRTRQIPFAELQRFLKGLGFREKHTNAGWVFEHATEGLLVFRVYGEDEAVDEGDIRSTRKFLDLRGLVEAEDFDAFLQQTSTPA